MEGSKHSRRVSVSGLLMPDDLFNLDELKDTGFLLDPALDSEIFKASPPKKHAEVTRSSVPAPVQDGSPGEPQVKKRKSKRNKLRNSMAWDQAFQTDEEPLLLQELEAIDIITLSESHTPPRTTKRPTAISIPRKKSFEVEAVISARDRTPDAAPFAELQSNMPIPSAGPSPKALVKSERRKKPAITESMAWNKAFQEEVDEELLTDDLPLSDSPVLTFKRKEANKVSELGESSDSCFTISQQKGQLSSTKDLDMTEGVLEKPDGHKGDAASSQAVQSLLSSFESLRTEASTSSVAWHPTASTTDEAESEAKHSPRGQYVRSVLEQALTPIKRTPPKGERRRKQPVSLQRPTATTVAIESAIQHGTKLRLPGRYNPNPPPKPSSKTPGSTNKEVSNSSSGESAKREETTKSASQIERSNSAAGVDLQKGNAKGNESEEPQKASEDMKALQAQLAAIQLERDSLQAKLEALSEGKGSSDAASEAASQKSKVSQKDKREEDGSALKQPKQTATLGFQPQAKIAQASKIDATKARVSPQLLPAVKPPVAKDPPTASAFARPSFLKKPSAKKDFFQGTSSVAVRQSPSVQKAESDGPAQPKASASKGPAITSKCAKPSPETSLLKRPSLLRKPSEIRTIKGGAFSTSAIQAACSVPLPNSPGIASPSPAKKQASPAVSRLSKPGFTNPKATKPLESTSKTFLSKLATATGGQSKIPTLGTSRLKPPGFKASSIAPEIIAAACAVPLPSSPMLPRNPSSFSTATIAPEVPEKLTRGSLLKPPSSLLKAACSVPLPLSPERSEALKPCASKAPAVEPKFEKKVSPTESKPLKSCPSETPAVDPEKDQKPFPNESKTVKPCASETRAVDPEKEPASGHFLTESVAEKKTIELGSGGNGSGEEKLEVTAVESMQTQESGTFEAIKDSEELDVKGAADEEASSRTATEVLPASPKKETLVETETVQELQSSVDLCNDLLLTAVIVNPLPEKAPQAVDPCHVSPSEAAEAAPSQKTEVLPAGSTEETTTKGEAMHEIQSSLVLSSDLPLTAASVKSPTKEPTQAVDACHVSPSESYPSLQLPSSSCLQPRRLSKKPGLPTIYSPALVVQKGDQIAEESRPKSPAARALFSSKLGRAVRVSQDEDQVTEGIEKEDENVGAAIEESSASETEFQLGSVTDTKGQFAETGESGSVQKNELASDGKEIMRPVKMPQCHLSLEEEPREVPGTEPSGSEKGLVAETEEPNGESVKARVEEEASVDATGLTIAGETSSEEEPERPKNPQQEAESSTESGDVFAPVEEEAVSKIEAQNSEEETSRDELMEGSKSPTSVVLLDAPSESGCKAADLLKSAVESLNESEAEPLAVNNEERSAAGKDTVKIEASVASDQDGVDVTPGSPESDAISNEDVEKLLQLEAMLLGALQQEQVAPGETVDELGGSPSEELGTADDVSKSALGIGSEMQKHVEGSLSAELGAADDVSKSAPGCAFEMRGNIQEQAETAAGVINAAAVSYEAETESEVSSEETPLDSTQEVTRSSSREQGEVDGDVSSGSAQAGSATNLNVKGDVRKAESEGLSAAAESASDVIKRLRARQAAVAALLDSPCKESESTKKDDRENSKRLGIRAGNLSGEEEFETAPSQNARFHAPLVEQEELKVEELSMPQNPEAAKQENLELLTPQSTLEESALTASNGKVENDLFGQTKANSFTTLPAIVPAHSPGYMTSSSCKAGEEMTKAEGESTTSEALGNLVASVTSPVSAAWEEAWLGTPIEKCPGEETSGEAVRSEKASNDVVSSAPKRASLANEAWGENDTATPSEILQEKALESEAFLQETALLKVPKINGQDPLSPDTPNLLSLAIPLFPSPETLADVSRQTLETRFEAHVEDETKALWDECLAKVRGKKRTSPCGQLRTSVGKKTPMRRSAEDLVGVAALRSSPPGVSPVSVLTRTPGRLRHALSESAPGLAGLMQSVTAQPGTVKSCPAILASPVVKPRGKAPGRRKKSVASLVDVSWEENDLDERIRAIEAMGEEAFASKSGRVQSSPPDKKEEVPANPYSPVKKRECGPFDCTKRTDNNLEQNLD